MPTKKQYKIGISFSNNYRRKYVEPLAEALLDLGFYKEEIFYYPWHEASINGPDGDIALQEIYNKKCKLIVVLLSPDYSKKVWAGHIEWRAVRDLINHERTKKKVCLLKVGDVDIKKIPGLPSGVTITKEIDELSAENVASFVVEKYHDSYPKDDDVSTSVDLARMKKQDEFLSYILELTEKDGMMRCMYNLFGENFADKRIRVSDISLLSIVQRAFQKLYDEHEQTEKVSDTKVFDNLMASKPVADMERGGNSHPLILSYLHIIKAFRAYFEKNYNKAIEEYKKAYDKMQNKNHENELSNVEKQTCVYLLNAIAWSTANQGKASLPKAIQLYKELFTKYPDADTYYFSWKYRRNYGVCLERDGQYVKALDQYEHGLSDYKSIEGSERSNEYKIYITCCSAMMKYWDLQTGKTSGKWISNTREQYNKKESFLTDELFSKIESRLELFHSAITGHNVPNKYPDYYNQKSKMLTYRMIISQDKDERKRIAYEIMKNLYTLEVVTRKGKGWRFVKRDFYYAQFELADDLEEKVSFLNVACEENEKLPSNDETKEFHDLLESKKSEILDALQDREHDHEGELRK